MFDAVSGVHQLREVLRALDSLPQAADTDERIERIALLEQVKNVAAAVQAGETAGYAAERRATVDRSGPGASRRAHQAERDLVGQLGLARQISPHAAARYVGFAVVLTRELPETYRVFRAGRTTQERAQLVAQHTVWLTREQRGEVDAILAGQLPVLGDRGVQAETRRHAYRLDPRGYVDRSARAEADRRVSLRPTPECMARLSAELPVAAGVAAYAALRRDADARHAAGDARTRAQIMADTLLERVLGAPAEHLGVQINLVMTDQSLLGPIDRDSRQDSHERDEPAWLDGYGPIPADLARTLALQDSTAPRWLRRLYLSPDRRQLVAMDSRRRLFTPAQRQFVRLRDRTCRTPYCDAPIRHIDHVTPAAAGGPTAISNAQGLCERCNHTKQTPAWTTDSQSDGTIITTTPTGRRYPSPPRVPPGGPPPGSRPQRPSPQRPSPQRPSPQRPPGTRHRFDIVWSPQPRAA